jgi:hypothetical protein
MVSLCGGMWWFVEDIIIINSIDIDKFQFGNGISEVFIGKMEVGEFAVDTIPDGVDEVIDGVVVGRYLVRCMMWLGWNTGFGIFNLGRVGSKETMA